MSSIKAYLIAPYQPTSISEIRTFEKKNKLVLPNSYTDFLLKTNGGTFCNYPAAVGNEKPCLYAIDGLFGLNVSFKYDDLQNSLDTLKYVSPNILSLNVLPIGNDPYGNFFCIRTCDRERSDVWFYDHETGELEELIAESFVTFLDNLYTGHHDILETNPFFQEIEYGDVDAVETMINKSEFDRNIRNTTGLSPLSYSVRKTQPRMCLFLLEQGFSPMEIDDFGYTPFHWVQDVETAELFLSRGVNVDIRTAKNETPFLTSLKRGFERVAIYLLQHGAQLNVVDDDGNDYTKYICFNEYLKSYVGKRFGVRFEP